MDHPGGRGKAGNESHAGAGINRIYVDGERDLVVVVRWIDTEAYDGFVERVLMAVVEQLDKIPR